MLALCLGTMGLPHVLVRYYTNPDGIGARRTTVTVIALLGVFYLFPPIYGALGRVAYPTLPAGVGSDTIVLRLPETLLPGLGRAAAHRDARRRRVRGVPVHGIRPGHVGDRRHRPGAAAAAARPGFAGGDVPGVRGFRVAAVLAVVIPYAVSRATEPLGLATTVGLAFAVAAATFAPLIMLGVWWRRLSTWGAMAGLVVGGLSALWRSRWTVATGPDRRVDRRAARQPGDVGDTAGRRDRGGRLARHAVADPGRARPARWCACTPRSGWPWPAPAVRD